MTRRGAAEGWDRRQVLALGLREAATVIAVPVTGVELVSHGVLPGKALLEQVDGACSVPVPPLAYAPLRPSFSGAFYSRARRRSVGYTIACLPGHRSGDELALAVTLHCFGGITLTPSPGCRRRSPWLSFDSVGDLGNRRRVAVEDRLVAGKLPQAGVVDRRPRWSGVRASPDRSGSPGAHRAGGPGQ
jgi:hypothetical protein